MRQNSIRVLVASVSILAGMSGSIVRAEDAPTSVYSDPRFADRAGTDNQSVYEKMATVSPMDGGSGAARSDYDAERAKFDDAVKTLNKTRDEVVSRMQNDPQFASMEKSLSDAKVHYDDEIDDALATMSWYDEYQDRIAAADKALQQLQLITKNSPEDKQTVANAQRRFDDARRAVETYEDDTLDMDPYVQAARQSFIATRDTRDKAIDQALASDLAVKSAQARVDELKQNLDALAANMPTGNVDQNAQARRDENQARPQPYDNSQPPQATEPSPAPEQPLVYDNGDSTAIPPSEYVAPEGGAYDYPPPAYAEPEVAYPEPYYSDYPYYYGGYPSYGLFFEIRSRYHHDHDHAYYDHYHHDHSNYDHSHQDYNDYRNNHGWANSGRYGSGSRDEQQSRADARDYQRQRQNDFNNVRAGQRERQMSQQAEQARQAALREQARREEFRADARRQDTQVNQSRREQQVRQADAQRVEAQRQADAQNTRARQRDVEAQAYAASQARAEQRRSQAEAQARAQADAQARADSQARARDQQQARSRDDGGSRSRSSGSDRSSGSGSNSGGGSNDRGGRYHR